MVAKALTLLSLALAVTSSPLIVSRQDAAAPAAPAAPKPAKGQRGGGLGSSGGSAAAPSSGSSSAGGALGGALGNLGMMSSSDVKGKEFACKKAALLFARGTGEPGNMGYVVGPGLGTSLKKQLNGDILIQGVDYSTDFSGGGAREMTTLSKSIFAKCPQTKIILGGYSQGAMQVHQALGSLGGDAGKIAAAVTFGDPYSTMGWGSGGMVGAAMGLGGSSGGGTPKGKGSPKGSPKGSSSQAAGAAEAAGAAGAAGVAGAAGSAGETPKPAAASAGTTGFNPQNGLIICSTGDFVCGVVPSFGASGPKGADVPKSSGGGGGGHLSYASDGSIPRAVTFIIGKIGAAAA